MSGTLPIELDRASSEPLYRQIESFVREAIDAGRLRPGQRLPSVRGLAGQLGVGRLTVATAYEELAAEGYLVSRMGFGTIVAPHPPSRVPAPTPGHAIDPGPGARRGMRVGPVRMPALRAAPGGGGPAHGRRALETVPRFDLRSGGAGGVGGSHGALAVGWGFERLLREEWRMLTESGGSGATADPAGDPLLRAAIAAHLRSSRGADCEPSQVVVLSGAVIGIGAAAQLWLGPDRRAVVEDPGDAVLSRALGRSGARLLPVAVDGNGLQPDGLPSEAAVAVVSPTVHIPTGAAMPLARRVRMLSWAASAGAILIEDARADDLALRGAPPVCLQGLDTDGRVIHLGGFESLLHGGVRMAYAVVPPPFVDPFVSALDAIDPGPSPVQQRALGRFVADGLFDRHATRVRRALLDRQEAVLEALERELGWLLEVRPSAGGTRMVATIVDPAWTAAGVVLAAADAGVALESLAPSRHAPAPDRELIVDYGHHDPAELHAAIRALGRGVAAARPQHGAHRPSRLPSLPTAAARA
ncbi:MAG TPA: PLP-dependent aminotransferase family protein [Candidatus Limnocylindrales bacterium]|nr:PLP-dependent aminotransferase family protein [Candidatus Limnocylindrales bacterium]